MYEASRLTRTLKRSKWLTIGVRIVRDRRSGLRDRLGRSERRTMGATHRRFSLEESLGYIDSVYEDYLTYGDLSAADIEGSRVLELGPGDNLGVALRFLGAGAASVTGVDRFHTWRDPAQQREIYTGLLERMSPGDRGRAESALSLEGEIRFDPERLIVAEGLPIEDAPAKLGAESFDFVISRAVMEHVSDTDRALEAIDHLLVPGGLSLHKIDYEDHGLFTTGGLHPLTYLTVPDTLYRWMGANSGIPNRRLNDYWRSKMEAYGYESRLFMTHLIGEHDELVPHPENPAPERIGGAVTLAEDIRAELLPRYRALPGETLAVSGAFLAARKPVN